MNKTPVGVGEDGKEDKGEEEEKGYLLNWLRKDSTTQLIDKTGQNPTDFSAAFQNHTSSQWSSLIWLR